MSTARDEAEKAWNNYYTENFLEVEKWAYIKGFEDAWRVRGEEIQRIKQAQQDLQRDLWNSMVRPAQTPIRDWYESRGLKVPPDAGK